ncbi:Alpha/Beta hydrolase protein [Parasitella parasitica]|nr:Alpha/Beta hydrolase protein [Parasitella parasitica]
MIFIGTCPVSQEKKSWIHKVAKETWKGVWIAPGLKDIKHAEEIAPEQDLVLFYAHGGGFTEGYSYMYMETFQAVINKLKREHNIRASIMSLEYRLSPEHKWPTACREAVECYRYLIHDLGISPSKVILAGDSAGGNLVATTLLQLKNMKLKKEDDLPPLPFPAGAALLSPWVDLTVQEYPNTGDTLTGSLLDVFKAAYVTDSRQLHHPLVSPVYGDFSRIQCPFFVAYGSQEILKPSIEMFISSLEKSKCSVTVLKGDQHTTHIWLVCSLMASSRAVYERDRHAFVSWIATSAVAAAAAQ